MVSFTVTYAVANVFLTLWGPIIVGFYKNALHHLAKLSFVSGRKATEQHFVFLSMAAPEW